MHRVFIGIGSNLGDREGFLKKAEQAISKLSQIDLVKQSPVYDTEPVGGPPQEKFLNAVWELRTRLSAQELHLRLQSVEIALGRNRAVSNGPRTIDLDILLFDDQIVREANLIIPHPRMHERWFVLKPLWDLAADVIHPVRGKSVCELLDACAEHH